MNGLNHAWLIFCENFRTALRTVETFDLLTGGANCAEKSDNFQPMEV
jgi:hypothetical protein